MINDIEEFIKYFHGQRRRTQWVIDALPIEKTDWRPWPDELSSAEIVRRIAAGHHMYATVVAFDYWVVDEYETLGPGWDESLAYFHSRTEEALDIIRPLPNKLLKAKRRRPDGNLPMTAWRFLMAMLVHEVSHRELLASYLMLLNVRRPEMGGASIEAVREALRKNDI